MPVVNGKHYPYTPEGKAQAKDAATQFGIGDVMKLVGASSNKFKLNVGKGQGYNRRGKYILDRDAPGSKYGPGYESPVREEDKSGAPTKYVPETKTSSEKSEAPKNYAFKSVSKSLVKSGYDFKKEKGTLTKSGTPFKLASGNTTPFKMMGSSPAQFLGGLFGGGGIGIRGIMDKIKAKREARRAKRLGLTAAAPGGGGEGGSHTHGTGGEAIGGAQAVAAAPAAPEMPAEELDEEVV